MKYSLIPLGFGQDLLNPIHLDSDDLLHQRVILGRNATTGLDHGGQNSIHISRQHVEVFFLQDQLYFKVLARQDNIVELNNNICDRNPLPLKEGDVISLIGALQFYNYEVKVSTPDLLKMTRSSRQSTRYKKSNENECIVIDDQPASKRARFAANGEVINVDNNNSDVVSLLSSSVSSSNKSSNSVTRDNNVAESAGNSRNSKASLSLSASSFNVAAILEVGASSTSFEQPQQIPSQELATAAVRAKTVINNLLRQYECIICYETIAGAVSLTPCGDTFCFCCINEWSTHSKTCPSCKSPFDLAFAVPSRVTDNAVREILKEEKEELAAWEERVTEGNEARKKFFDEKAASSVPAKAAHSTSNTGLGNNNTRNRSIQHAFSNGRGMVDLT